jgi:PAT family beta-lactamase induction signal transducer AmpG
LSFFPQERDYRRKLLLVGILYYAEGIPYGFLFKTLGYYLSAGQISLTVVGLAGLLHLPWSLKFIWAPLLDRFGPRWVWIASSQALLIAALSLFPWMDLNSSAFVCLLILVALAGATQDIAIDAYTIDILTPEEQGPANGVRVTAYRVALIASGGLMVWLSDYLGWAGAVTLFVLSLALVWLAVLFWPLAHAAPVPEQAKARSSLLSAFRLAWLGVIRLPHLGPVVLFIFFFKAGEAFLGQMVGPFWVQSGFSPAQFGLVSGVLGTVLTIIGSLGGGVLVNRWGLGLSLWLLGGLQALSNLGYSLAACWPGWIPATYGASMVESFCGGLGNAPLLTLLMRLCNREASAGQYAILSAIFSLSGAGAASWSGYTAETLGFFWCFTISFVISLPAFALLPFLPLDKKE